MTGRDQADCVQLMRMPHCFYRTRHLFGLTPPSLYGSHRTMIKLLTFELPITIKCAHTNKKKSRLAALAPYPELKFHCMCIAKKGRQKPVAVRRVVGLGIQSQVSLEQPNTIENQKETKKIKGRQDLNKTIWKITKRCHQHQVKYSVTL